MSILETGLIIALEETPKERTTRSKQCIFYKCTVICINYLLEITIHITPAVFMNVHFTGSFLFAQIFITLLQLYSIIRLK